MIEQRWVIKCDHCGAFMRNGSGCIVTFDHEVRAKLWMKANGWTWRNGLAWCGCEIK